jgi:uncharacterized protein YkwD
VTLLPALVLATVAFTAPASVPATPNLTGLALPPLTACAGQTDLAASAAAQKQAMRCVLNATRSSVGLRTLRAAKRLNRSAALRAAAIRRCNQFSHRPCGQSFMGVFIMAGYLGSGLVGENLAWSQSPLGTVRDTVTDWLTSPEHRSNMLYPRWRDVGVAMVKASSLFGTSNVTLWVMDFGRH